MRIFAFETYEEMSRHAAAVMAAEVKENPRTVLGLATGSTPLGMYAELGRMCRAGEISFRDVTTVNLDEYYGLTPDHEMSYRYFMEKNFFSQIDILPENTHLPDGTAPSPAMECQRYDRLIDSVGGIGMQLLGIGHDGHIGFNEPADQFVPGTNYVRLTEETIRANARFFASEEDVPRYALTTGIRAIMQAKKILMVVNGAEKAEILCRALFGPITPQVPASILQLHPDVTVCGDAPAMAMIREKFPAAIEN